MSAATILTPDESAETPEGRQLVVAHITNNPPSVFEAPAVLDVLYAELEREVADAVPDLTTQAGRKKITALSAKVTRFKTTIDAAGKDLNAELRGKINAVDEVRRSMRDRLDSLADLARQPLTDWENEEARRKAQIVRDLQDLQEAGLIFNDDTVEQLEVRLTKLKEMEISAETFRDFATEAEGRRKRAVEAIENGIQRIRDEERRAAEHEAQQAELAQLRAEKEVRDRQDAARAEVERIQREEEARLAREKADKEAAEKAEQERQAREAEQRERERIKADQRMKDAAEAAEKRAREDAEREKREIEERHQAELRAIEEATAQKERDRLAEEKRLKDAAAAEAARNEAEARRLREAEEKRQADKRHRAKVKGEVIAALIAALETPKDGLLGADGGFEISTRDGMIIDAVVEHIAAGSIIHTTIQF